MLKASNQIQHNIVVPVIYDISALNLTLLPAEVQQHINESTEMTRISQADTPTKPDGTIATFWYLYKDGDLLPSETFEGTDVADNFLATCLL